MEYKLVFGMHKESRPAGTEHVDIKIHGIPLDARC